MAANATATTPASDAVQTRDTIRNFHLTGRGLDDLTPTSALRPTVLEHLPALPDLEAFYPMCVSPDGLTRSLREVVHELEHAGIIVSAFRGALNGRPYAYLEETLEAAVATLGDCPKAELGKLRKLLPAGAFLVGFHSDAAVLLHAAALAAARQTQRKDFWHDVRRCAARLREILLLDDSHAPGAVSSESVTASMGGSVGTFFQSDLLARALQRPANPLRRMASERRSRCEKVLSELEQAAHDAANQPAFWLFHSGIFGATSAPAEVVAFNGYAKWSVDSFAAALQFCDTRLEHFAVCLRALRIARLEIESAYEPALHDEMLERFDWQSANAAELQVIPPIVVVETASYFGQASLTSFGKLLRSGRPVQIMILRNGIEPQDITEFTPDFGHLAIAHRESFVLQSSMAQPSHLLPGLTAMAKTLRPAVAVISTPKRDAEDREAWLEETLLVLSRASLLYAYDPESGARWAERFRLSLPDPASEELNAAHAVAVSPALRQHFRLIPAAAWSSEQMELASYLAACTGRAPKAIPYLWVEGSAGTQQRALLTRDLVNFCIDRRRAAALFEELAGLGQPQIVPDENARREGARDAIQRVIAILTA